MSSGGRYGNICRDVTFTGRIGRQELDNDYFDMVEHTVKRTFIRNRKGPLISKGTWT